MPPIIIHVLLSKIFKMSLKIQTKGYVNIDKEGRYINDYYLNFNNRNPIYYHIHLALHNFIKTRSFYNNFVYILKKYDNYKKEIVHSKEFKINCFSDPKKIVQEMIYEYNEFIKSN